jgi:hypothetical protein
MLVFYYGESHIDMEILSDHFLRSCCSFWLVIKLAYDHDHDSPLGSRILINRGKDKSSINKYIKGLRTFIAFLMLDKLVLTVASSLTDHHDINEILLKVALNTISQAKPHTFYNTLKLCKMLVFLLWRITYWYTLKSDLK